MLSSVVTPVPPLAPKRGNIFTKALGRFVLWMLGWRVTGELANTRHCMIIAAPHTSNFDGVIVIAAMLALGLQFSFFGKEAIFRWPFGGIMRWFGGIPINREQSHDVVAFSAQQFAERPELWLAITPEGTRTSADQWKTGFYWIAMKANVPILMVAFDYGNRKVDLLGLFHPSGDLDKDLPEIIQRYKGIVPKHPELLSKPLRDN